MDKFYSGKVVGNQQNPTGLPTALAWANHPELDFSTILEERGFKLLSVSGNCYTTRAPQKMGGRVVKFTRLPDCVMVS